MSNVCAPTFNLSRVPKEFPAAMAILTVLSVKSVAFHDNRKRFPKADSQLYWIRRENRSDFDVRTGPPAVWPRVARGLAPQTRPRSPLPRPLPARSEERRV